jgi:hypothetical protein
MGTIILCEMMRRWPTLPYTDVVFMAAACSIREFEIGVLPVLNRPGSTVRFYNLSLHPDAELREINAGDLPHRGTLLNWIDNFYTTPETWMNRTLGKWSNIIPAAHLIPRSTRPRVTLKAFGLGRNPDPPPGSRTRGVAIGTPGPQRHDDFIEYEFWNEGFWTARANEQPKTSPLHVGWITRGGYGARQAGGDWSAYVEAGAGLLLHRTAYLGVSGRRLVGDPIRGEVIAPDGRRLTLEMDEIGFDIDYVDAYFTTGTFIGGGRARWKDPAGDLSDRETNYFLFEPSIYFHKAVSRHAALELGAGYRVVAGADEPGFSNETVQGWVFGLRLDLGQFEMNRWKPASAEGPP